jgi:hypothetical protein
VTVVNNSESTFAHEEQKHLNPKLQPYRQIIPAEHNRRLTSVQDVIIDGTASDGQRLEGGISHHVSSEDIEEWAKEFNKRGVVGPFQFTA